MPKPSKYRTAKKKIKEQVCKKETFFIPTEEKAIRWWKIINLAAFKGQLELPPIEIRRLMTAHGRCDIRAKGITVISLNKNIRSRNLFIATIAHEMVHQYQWTTIGYLDHGKLFRQWKKFFKKSFKIDI